MSQETLGSTIGRFVGQLITGRDIQPETPHHQVAAAWIENRGVYEKSGTTPDTLRRAAQQGSLTGTNVHLLLEDGEWVKLPYYDSAIVNGRPGVKLIAGVDEAGNPQVVTYTNFSEWRAELLKK